MQFKKPTATLSGSYYWVHHRDPAFAKDAEGLSAAAIDEALLGNHGDRIDRWTKPGSKGPARFKLRHLSMDTVRALIGYADQAGWPLALRRACACALEAIENPSGQPVPLGASVRDPALMVDSLSNETMEMLEYAGCDEGLERGEIVTAIGSRALRSSKAPGNS
jgi:hypothetical protein